MTQTSIFFKIILYKKSVHHNNAQIKLNTHTNQWFIIKYGMHARNRMMLAFNRSACLITINTSSKNTSMATRQNSISNMHNVQETQKKSFKTN